MRMNICLLVTLVLLDCIYENRISAKPTDVSEERVTPIFRVEEEIKRETSMKKAVACCG
jgi:hypothetical protein